MHPDGNEQVPTPTARALPRTVVVLGSVSLLADVASEMVMPLLPAFLTTTLGAGPAALGLIEGVAETTASFLKLVGGRLTDRGWSARRLAAAGYALPALARPALAIVRSWGHVLALRFVDRVGKGLRTAPRDAMLSAAVDSSIRGRAFGFHRSMDHAGATIGPLIAALLLALGLQVRHVFVAAFVPGALAAVLVAVGVRDRRRDATRGTATVPKLRWSALDARVRRLLVAAGLLAFASVPDVFLVLWVGSAGLATPWIPVAWALASAARALTAWPAGRLSDALGRPRVLVSAWTLRCALLVAMGVATSVAAVVALLLLYSACTAATEGAERAFIGDAAPPELRGSAFGAYHMVVGIVALPGAAWLGFAWQTFGVGWAFASSAAVTALGTAWLVMGQRSQRA